MRWKSNKNITNTPYIFDTHSKRQYWLDDEGYIIACIMNKYEQKIEELESFIESKKYGTIPTMFDCLIDNTTAKFKRKFQSVLDRNMLKQGDGWVISTIEEFDGEKYEISLNIKEVE